jgi:hypothetical protein
MASVRVVRAGGGDDPIYVDGNYRDSPGTVGGPAFGVDAGERTFETLGPNGNPNWSATQTIYEGAVTTVTLQPVAIV